jgi:hypothetical protein
MLLTACPELVTAATATRAINATSSAYSSRSWPESSRHQRAHTGNQVLHGLPPSASLTRQSKTSVRDPITAATPRRDSALNAQPVCHGEHDPHAARVSCCLVD